MMKNREVIEKLMAVLKKYKFVLAILFVGIVILMLPSGNGDSNEAVTNYDEIPEFSISEQEKKMETILSEYKGAGRVKVMLTLKESTEQILAQDTERESAKEGEEEKSDVKTETVILTKDSGEKTAVLKYIYPEYRGAVVVASGANSPEVKLEITKAVSALTGLTSEKITVLTMKE